MTPSTSHMSGGFSEDASRGPRGRADGAGGSAGRITEPFFIGPVKLSNRLVQAPMAGISGRAFRVQARRFGAGMTVTEMVSGYGVHYGNRRTLQMLELVEGEHPVAVQLFGNLPAVMAEAAVASERAGADIIDVNMGCPARKVIKTGAGVALMRDEGLAAEIVSAIAGSVRVPVMAKMRSGFGGVSAPSLARRLVEAGAAAICIHPRTGQQGWRGRADHGITARLAAELEAPVIASGDVNGPVEVERLLGEVGAAAVMIGRAALGNPWLFPDLLAGREPRRRQFDEVIEAMGRFYQDVVAEMGEERAHRYMRKFYGWYLGPFGLSGDTREALRKAESFEKAARLAEEELG